MNLSEPRAKVIHLEQFSKARNRPIPNGDLGGRGFPDPDILPFCDWLNTFDGVYTLQSCAGHSNSERNGAAKGHIWVWLDKPFQSRLSARACKLVQPPLEQINLRYIPEGEFIEIIFEGNESGRLNESLAALKVLFNIILLS